MWLGQVELLREERVWLQAELLGASKLTEQEVNETMRAFEAAAWRSDKALLTLVLKKLKVFTRRDTMVLLLQ